MLRIGSMSRHLQFQSSEIQSGQQQTPRQDMRAWHRRLMKLGSALYDSNPSGTDQAEEEENDDTTWLIQVTLRSILVLSVERMTEDVMRE